MGDMDDFLPSIMFVSKYIYIAKINKPSAQKSGAYGNYYFFFFGAFSAAQEIYSKLQNQANCNLLIF